MLTFNCVYDETDNSSLAGEFGELYASRWTRAFTTRIRDQSSSKRVQLLRCRSLADMQKCRLQRTCWVLIQQEGALVYWYGVLALVKGNRSIQFPWSAVAPRRTQAALSRNKAMCCGGRQQRAHKDACRLWGKLFELHASQVPRTSLQSLLISQVQKMQVYDWPKIHNGHEYANPGLMKPPKQQGLCVSALTFNIRLDCAKAHMTVRSWWQSLHCAYQ